VKKTTCIRDALNIFLKESGLGISLKNQAVRKAWEKVVGPEIASRTRMVAFKRGAVTIEVASSSLYSELKTYYMRSLVDSVQQEMGNKKVKSLKFRLGEFVGDGEDVEEEHRS